MIDNKYINDVITQVSIEEVCCDTGVVFKKTQGHHQLAEWLTELKNRRAAEILIVAELSNLKAEFVNITSQIRSREN